MLSHLFFIARRIFPGQKAKSFKFKSNLYPEVGQVHIKSQILIYVNSEIVSEMLCLVFVHPPLDVILQADNGDRSQRGGTFYYKLGEKEKKGKDKKDILKNEGTCFFFF